MVIQYKQIKLAHDIIKTIYKFAIVFHSVDCIVKLFTAKFYVRYKQQTFIRILRGPKISFPFNCSKENILLLIPIFEIHLLPV